MSDADKESDINKEIRIFQEIGDKASAFQNSAAHLNAEAVEKLKLICERIKNGETTGDRIRDYVFAHYGFISAEIEAVYRELGERVRRHIGEFILVVIKRDTIPGPIVVIGSGVLKDAPHAPEFVGRHNAYQGSSGGCKFPTGRCAILRVDGSVGIYHYDLTVSHPSDVALDLNKSFIGDNKSEPDLKMEIKIGDAEVKEWFMTWRNEKYCDVFAEMAKLLGRPVTESPRETEFRRRRKVAAERISGLVKERDRLKREIELVFKSGRGGAYSADGIGVTVCEIEGIDARIIFIELHRDLKKAEDEIREQLEAILALGAGDDFRELCREYGVE